MNYQKLKQYYMREHSNEIRVWKGADDVTMDEDPILKSTGKSDLGRFLLVTFCRNKQRCLQQVWQIWVKKCGTTEKPLHDYNYDLRALLSRSISLSENRTELEIEVMYKWAMQKQHIDPSGIANVLITCKSKKAVVSVLNEMRLEIIMPGDPIVFQDTLARAEDGLFTILSGKCEIIQFLPESRSLLQLLDYYSSHDWDAARELLVKAKPIVSLAVMSGFGEGSTLTNSKRNASVIASTSIDAPTEIIVVPKAAFLGCAHSSGTDTNLNFEAVDFLRSTGLVKHLNVSEVISIADDMETVTFK